jgi:hypothetical protein
MTTETKIPIVTVEGGFFKPGLTGHVVGAGERDVFLNECKARLPEFTVVLDAGARRDHCEYGKDFQFNS